MRIGVIAPNPALRAGLRALLDTTAYQDTAKQAASAAASADGDPEADARPGVVMEAASLDDFAASGIQVDVLIVTGAVFSLTTLRRNLADSAGQLALLLLADDPKIAQSLLSVPLQAWGVLPTDSSAEELQAAVRALNEGLLVGAPALLRGAFAQAGQSGAFSAALLSTQAEENETLNSSLTERESQVLQLLARGMANKQIAAALHISEHTVKFHVSSIYTKLGATNRAEAVRTGIQHGLVIL